MASNQVAPNLLQCTGCNKELDFNSKTLKCFHTFCKLCLEKEFKDKKNGNVKCPQCNESVDNLDQLELSSFLSKSLRRRQLENNDLKCDMCLDLGKESSACNSCNDCRKIFCDSCTKFHKTLLPKHKPRNLEGIEKNKVIEAMLKDVCSLHQKEKDSYCNTCNDCFCSKCYKEHLVHSPRCSPQKISVKAEASTLKLQGPTLTKEMADLQIGLRKKNRLITDYTNKLTSECNLKCKQLWENYEEIMKKAEQRTNQLCEEIKELTTEQVERWRQLMEENEKILKQLEIWKIHLESLLNDSLQQNVDVVCGLKSLKAKLSSPRLHKSMQPVEKCQLEVSSPDWWLQIMEELKSNKIGSVSLKSEKFDVNELILDQQFILQGSNFSIQSIHVSPEDGHIFLCDFNNKSVIEYTESGRLVDECQLSDRTNKFDPFGICSISPDVLVIACIWEKKLIYLERKKVSSFLRIKQIIQTEMSYYSLFERNGTIFACTYVKGCFQIDLFTKEGKQLKTIKSKGSVNGFPIIRSDPLNENIWVTSWNSSEVFCFNLNGEKLCSVKTKEDIFDFCLNEFGQLFFCTKEGIFSSSPEKLLWKFNKRSEVRARMFILKHQLFVCLKIDGKYSFKIFKLYH